MTIRQTASKASSLAVWEPVATVGDVAGVLVFWQHENDLDFLDRNLFLFI